MAAASSRRWCGRTPGLRVVGDVRKQPPQLNHSRQLAALLERGPEHRWSMGIRTQDRQLPSRPATDSPPQTFPPPPRGRITMADDLKDRGAQDRSQVNVQEDYEVRYWTQKWGVSKEQLTAAVQKVGVSVNAVARELGKE